MRHIIVGYNDINAYPTGGIEGGTIAIVCTGKGYLPWHSSEGICTMADFFYSEDYDGTLVSPTTVVRTN